MKSPFVSVEDLTLSFPGAQRPALDSLSFELPQGSLCGVVGPDAAGKTTLVRTLAGLLKPQRGNVSIQGHDSISEAEQLRKLVGYMPQHFGLYEELTVKQNVELFATLHNAHHERGRMQDLLEFASLSRFLDRPAGALSGGMKRKLGLICCMIRHPELLLLDEPTAGVDPRSHDDFWGMIKTLNSQGSTIVWSTCDLLGVEAFDYILLMHEGQKLYFGAPEEVTERTSGRVFRVMAKPEDKRELLSQLAQLPKVLDTTIQGDSLRVVLKRSDSETNVRDLGVDRDQRLEPISPRFEDGFVDLLGGASEHVELSHSVNSELLTTGPPVRAEGLTKTFGTFTAVDNVSFSLKRGEIFGLLGPNGAGKSTTFKMLCGLIRASHGVAEVEGRSLINAATAARACIGYMAQSFSLYDNLTVAQNLRFFAGIYGVQKATSRIRDLTAVLHMEPLLESFPKDLSLGFQQRLALACALLHGPPVLFLDEPTAGVDPLTRREFWHHVNRLTQQGATVLVSTHYMDEAEFCDRIAFIHEGKLKVIDTPSKLIETVTSKDCPNPTLHDAFLQLCED